MDLGSLKDKIDLILQLIKSKTMEKKSNEEEVIKSKTNNGEEDLQKSNDEEVLKYTDFVKEWFKKNPDKTPGDPEVMEELSKAWMEYKKEVLEGENEELEEAEGDKKIVEEQENDEELEENEKKESKKEDEESENKEDNERDEEEEKKKKSSKEDKKVEDEEDEEDEEEEEKEKKSFVEQKYIDLGQGIKLKSSKFDKLYEFVVDNVELGIYINEDRIQDFKKILFKEAKDMSLTFEYIKGKSFKDSFLVVKQGSKKYQYSMEEILPEEVKKSILNCDPTVITPQEMIEQLKENYKDIEQVRRWAERRIAKYLSKKKKTAAELWTLRDDEVEVQTKLDKPQVTMDEEEVESDRPEPVPDSTAGKKVKDYLNRLPDSGVGPQITALRPGEAKIKAENEDLKLKLKKAEEELRRIKEEQEKKAKADEIFKIISELKKKNLNINVDKAIETLKTLNLEDLGKIRDLVGLLEKEAQETKVQDIETEFTGNIAPVFETYEDSTDILTKLSEIWNK